LRQHVRVVGSMDVLREKDLPFRNQFLGERRAGLAHVPHRVGGKPWISNGNAFCSADYGGSSLRGTRGKQAWHWKARMRLAQNALCTCSRQTRRRRTRDSFRNRCSVVLGVGQLQGWLTDRLFREAKLIHCVPSTYNSRRILRFETGAHGHPSGTRNSPGEFVSKPIIWGAKPFSIRISPPHQLTSAQPVRPCLLTHIPNNATYLR
jgi:hypothetical protein